MFSPYNDSYRDMSRLLFCREQRQRVSFLPSAIFCSIYVFCWLYVFHDAPGICNLTIFGATEGVLPPSYGLNRLVILGRIKRDCLLFLLFIPRSCSDSDQGKPTVNKGTLTLCIVEFKSFPSSTWYMQTLNKSDHVQGHAVSLTLGIIWLCELAYTKYWMDMTWSRPFRW